MEIPSETVPRRSIINGKVKRRLIERDSLFWRGAGIMAARRALMQEGEQPDDKGGISCR